MPECFFLVDFEQVFYEIFFCLEIFVSLCSSGSWNFLARNNVAAPEK